MEGSSMNKDQEIAGPAAALFGDSSSPYDAFFASDTKNSTFQTTTQQDNQSTASFFDSLANEQPSQPQQITTDYSSYYGYNHISNALQEGTNSTVTNATGAQQYSSTEGYDYNNYYGGQYASNTNGITEGVNSSVDPQSTTQYQYDYAGYSYDASYANGQNYSQYYDYSHQQQYYDPNDPNYYYYQDPSAYYQYPQEINNSNENNFQINTQGSINIEQQQQQEDLLQELPDQTNSNRQEEGKDTLDNIQMDNVGEVDTSTHNESKQNIGDALKPDAELADLPSELSTTDVDNFKNDNKNREFSSDNDKENKEISREVEYSPRKESIERQGVVQFQEHLTISSSSNLTSPNNENVAAVALVETIETNHESAQFTVTSAETINDSPTEKDSALNSFENEDQEVNIIHGDDHDIFEYQPQELESHPKLELLQVEPPVSSLTDESKITSEISAVSEIEEINDKSKDEPTKLDDLDDLVLGSTSKSTSKVSAYTELGSEANTQERYSTSAQDSDTIALNSSSYQYDYSGQDWGSNDTNYQYQEYDANQTTGDTTTSTEQAKYQYQGNNASQTMGHAKYQYNGHGTSQPAAESTTEEEQSYQYSSSDTKAGVDNTTGTNQTDYQYFAYDSRQTIADNSSALYQNNYGYEANQITAVDAVTGTDQSNYQYQGYDMGDITVDTTAGQEQSNYQYQVYEAGQATMDNNDGIDQTNYQYGTNQVYQAGTDQTNYQYQENEADTKAGTDQSNYQYYQGYQPIVASHLPQTSPPPMSPSPRVSCPDPQCGGENKVTAKFCSDCGNPINNVMNTITPAISISKVTGNTNLYNNNLNAYSGQSLPYNHSQASYPASSFASYSNHPTSINDTQYLERDPQISQQYYGAGDMNTLNDPLGRSKGCRPIVAFGFGGKIYTMFPRTVQRFTSTDQNTPIIKSAPGAFTVRVLKDIIPVSDISDFPGPLLMDNNRGGVKAKRRSVLKYLNDQIQAAENNISSFNGEEVEKEKLEAIVIIWNLFKIMFENEGALVGSLKVEELVRKILVPSANKSDNDEANFTVPADTGFDDQKGFSQPPETTSLTYSISTNAVDKLQELMLKGDRVAAIHHAMNENLWAHALIIASCVNKDLWKEVVIGFVKHEMGTRKGDSSESNGRESLRVLYSLFSGQGQNAVQEFLPCSNLLNQVAQSPVTAMLPTSHYSTNPNSPYSTSTMTMLHTSSSDHNVSLDSLVKWRETIAMILANRAPGDNQAISALGDILKEYGWIHAAHVCYILSPNTSIASGFDAPNVRFTLLGNNYTHNLSISNFYNWQSLHMTEIYEFGLSLNSNDGGLPHLQAYKLIYAWWLADCGYLNEARRYCESIANIVKVYTKGSPYFHGCFLQKLKDLTQRLLEHGGNSNGTNESSSWLFAKKMPKATLDSLWGSLEGKFIKFVAGDAVDDANKTSSSSTSETIGPFSHFSSITHPTSEVPSRSASASDFRSIPNPTVDTRRATTPGTILQKQLNGNQRRSSTPGVGVQSNGGYNNTFSPTTSDGQNTMSSVPEGESPTDDKTGYYGNFGGQDQQYSSSYGYSSYNNFDNTQQSATNNGYSNSYSYGASSNEQQSTQPGYNYSDNSSVESNNKQKQQTMYPYYQPLGNTYKNDSAWWNNPNADTTEDQKADQTQTDDIGETEFISPMGNNFTPFVPSTSTSNRNDDLNDDFNDDLGLGNNAFGYKKKNDPTTDSVANTNNDNNETKNQTEQKQEEKQEEQKEEEKKGWFGRWFGKKEGGKTANLGEESSFYFDPVQKRWINKKAGTETNNTLTPPPPPPQRSKTTSPQPSRSIMSSNPNRQSLPPIEDNNNLTGTPSNAPPPPNKGGRASSASMKRGVRSRYVDIINQPPLN